MRHARLIDDVLAAATARGITVYLQVMAASPPGYRVQFSSAVDADQCLGPDGLPHPARVDRNASLASTEVVAYTAALVADVARGDARRIDDAFRFAVDKGVAFHWKEADAADFDENATREQLRDYLAVLDLLTEYKADCLGWQYQLGLLPLRPPSDFAEGLFNSTCRPESNGDTVACATEADQGNALPMEMLKRLLVAKGLHQAVMFHDLRWGAEHDGRFLWLLLNSGSCDPLLQCREASEHRYLREVVEKQAKRTAWLPWQPEEPVGPDALAKLAASNLEPVLA